MTGYVMSVYIFYTGDSLEPGADGEGDGNDGTGRMAAAASRTDRRTADKREMCARPS